MTRASHQAAVASVLERQLRTVAEYRSIVEREAERTWRENVPEQRRDPHGYAVRKAGAALAAKWKELQGDERIKIVAEAAWHVASAIGNREVAKHGTAAELAAKATVTVGDAK